MTEMPTDDIERIADECACSMLARDNSRMRSAGSELAEAAMHVIREYDGVHRLALAVSKWALAIANEGDRPHLQEQSR